MTGLAMVGNDGRSALPCGYCLKASMTAALRIPAYAGMTVMMDAGMTVRYA